MPAYNGMNYISKVHMVISPVNFRDEEFFETKKVLEECNCLVTVSSTTRMECLGMLGGKVIPDELIEEMECSACDALVLVGGIGAKIFFDNEVLFHAIKVARDRGKIIAAICIAPSILANAGIFQRPDGLRGVRATSFISEKINLESKGAIYVNKGVVRDANIITAQGPSNAKEFAKTICEALHGNHKK